MLLYAFASYGGSWTAVDRDRQVVDLAEAPKQDGAMAWAKSGLGHVQVFLTVDGVMRLAVRDDDPNYLAMELLPPREYEGRFLLAVSTMSTPKKENSDLEKLVSAYDAREEMLEMLIKRREQDAAKAAPKPEPAPAAAPTPPPRTADQEVARNLRAREAALLAQLRQKQRSRIGQVNLVDGIGAAVNAAMSDPFRLILSGGFSPVKGLARLPGRSG